MRERDKVFVEVMKEQLSNGVPESEAKVVALRAARETVTQKGAPWSDRAVARHADIKLTKRHIREELAAFLEQETGMGSSEMLQIRVGIARGENIDPKTTPIQLRALEGLEKLVFVPPTQRVEIDQRSHLSAVVMGDLAEGVPAMSSVPVERNVTPLDPAIALRAVTVPEDDDEDDDADES